MTLLIASLWVFEERGEPSFRETQKESEKFPSRPSKPGAIVSSGSLVRCEQRWMWPYLSPPGMPRMRVLDWRTMRSSSLKSSSNNNKKGKEMSGIDTFCSQALALRLLKGTPRLLACRSCRRGAKKHGSPAALCA